MKIELAAPMQKQTKPCLRPPGILHFRESICNQRDCVPPIFEGILSLRNHQVSRAVAALPEGPTRHTACPGTRLAGRVRASSRTPWAGRPDLRRSVEHQVRYTVRRHILMI